MSFGYDEELPAGYQDADLEMAELAAAGSRSAECDHGWRKVEGNKVYCLECNADLCPHFKEHAKCDECAFDAKCREWARANVPNVNNAIKSAGYPVVERGDMGATWIEKAERACSDCEQYARIDRMTAKPDGRVICSSCQKAIEEKARDRAQPDLFVEQRGLFQ